MHVQRTFSMSPAFESKDTNRQRVQGNGSGFLTLLENKPATRLDKQVVTSYVLVLLRRFHSVSIQPSLSLPSCSHPLLSPSSLSPPLRHSSSRFFFNGFTVTNPSPARLPEARDGIEYLTSRFEPLAVEFLNLSKHYQ